MLRFIETSNRVPFGVEGSCSNLASLYIYECCQKMFVLLSNGSRTKKHFHVIDTPHDNDRMV